jgi:hypothetical protein
MSFRVTGFVEADSKTASGNVPTRALAAKGTAAIQKTTTKRRNQHDHGTPIPHAKTNFKKPLLLLLLLLEKLRNRTLLS